MIIKKILLSIGYTLSLVSWKDTLFDMRYKYFMKIKNISDWKKITTWLIFNKEINVRDIKYFHWKLTTTISGNSRESYCKSNVTKYIYISYLFINCYNRIDYQFNLCTWHYCSTLPRITFGIVWSNLINHKHYLI